MPLDTQYRKDIVLIYILIYLPPPAVRVLPPHTEQRLSIVEAIHSCPVRLTFSFLVPQDTSCCQSYNKNNPRDFLLTAPEVSNHHIRYIFGVRKPSFCYMTSSSQSFL